MKKIPVILLLVLAFALLQMSFFVYFFPAGFIPNIIILGVVLLGIFEKRDSAASLAAALFGGFLIDLFSGGIIGFWALALVSTSFVIKFVLEDYVRFPIPKKF